MQAEGLDDVPCAISAGTGTQRNGRPQNALHFRKEFYKNNVSGDHVTSWGTIEMDNKGTEIEKPVASSATTRNTRRTSRKWTRDAPTRLRTTSIPLTARTPRSSCAARPAT